MSTVGRYDHQAERILVEEHARATVVIVIEGEHGNGFSVATIDANMVRKLPDLLRQVAKGIEAEGEAKMKDRLREVTPPGGTN